MLLRGGKKKALGQARQKFEAGSASFALRAAVIIACFFPPLEKINKFC